MSDAEPIRRRGIELFRGEGDRLRQLNRAAEAHGEQWRQLRAQRTTDS